MIEHRLIERMIALINQKLEQIEATKKINPLFIDTAVDFMRFYADRTHHGKEEDILFRNLDKKDLSGNDRDLMNELIQDHVFARKTTGELVEGNNEYRNGDLSALGYIVKSLQTLANFYPKHIFKEDNAFFPASRNYLSEKEEDAMVQAFWEFDRKMIHEKYKSVVGEREYH